MTFSSTRPNLSIDAQGSNDGAYPGGEPIERIITVHNRGSETADINLWIRPNDAKSSPLIRWCTLMANEFTKEGHAQATLALPLIEQRDDPLQEQEQGFSGVRLPHVKSRESREVILRFDVPPQAEPGFYSYEIFAQAPVYAGEQSSRIQQFRVLSSGQDAELRGEPSWSLEPPTSSDQPYSLTAGGTFHIDVQVHNCTEVVDRYHLRCPELDERWFSIEYPEANPDAPGLVALTDGLMLNPGESGTIQLTLHPPIYTPAGYYSSSLRLISFVRDNLVLLDVIYLNVAVDDRLIADLHPSSRKIPSLEEWFQLNLTNPGNIPHDIAVKVTDAGNIFTYKLATEVIKLLPGQTHPVLIHPHPQKWWRRTWRGQEQTIEFTVEFHPVPLQEAATAQPVVPASALMGQIVWQSRSPWIRRLLLLLSALLLLTGAGWLLYWLLREFVIEPSLEPKILEFATTEASYQAGQGNPIRLDWEISNPNPAEPTQDGISEKAGRAIVTYYTNDGEAVFSKLYSLPELAEQQEITCEPGIHRPNMMLRLLRMVYGYPSHTATLTCLGVSPQPVPPTPAFAPGKYQIKLETIPIATEAARASQDQSPSDTKRLKEIELTPPPPPAAPEISHFYSKSPIYRQKGGEASSTNVSPQYPTSPIQLNWIINNAEDIATLELGYVNVAADGAIQNHQVRYTIEKGIPTELEELCRLQDKHLICENVPTDAEDAGQYTFTLIVIRPKERNTTRIAKDTKALAIRPPLPQIQSFKVNGQDVLENPQVVQILNPARGAVDINLAWQVENPDQVKVELLPAPGEIDASKNQMSYALSPTPGSTKLTLQVTNQAGEMASRSVTIQTAEFTPPADAVSSPNSGSSPGSLTLPTPPPPPDVAVPSFPPALDTPPAYELPPRSN